MRRVLLIICLVSVGTNTLHAAGKEYFRTRNNPNLVIILDKSDKSIPIDSTSIHDELAQRAAKQRQQFKKEDIERKWQELKGTLGNIAIARLDFVFGDGDIKTVDLASRNGKIYFTTMTLDNADTYKAKDLGDSFLDFFSLLLE